LDVLVLVLHEDERVSTEVRSLRQVDMAQLDMALGALCVLGGRFDSYHFGSEVRFSILTTYAW
jgi:hypothetical protein